MAAHSTSEQKAVLRSEAQTWLLLLLSGQVSAADAEAFRLWCGRDPAHRQAFAEVRLLWENLGPAVRAVAAREQAAPARTPHRLPETSRAAPRSMSRRAFLGGTAIAASTACLMLLRPPWRLWPGLSELDADFRTGTGEQRQLEIVPGVVVEMNTQTSINLRPGRDGSPGMELMSGEAQVLNLAPQAKPFSIYAAGGCVVTGADSQCNVRCTGAQVQVICLRGSTELKYLSQSKAIAPAQQVSYGAQGIGAPATVDPEVALAWRRRVLIFDDQPLAEVVAEINRYRPGKIILMDDALAARKVHARFSLNQLADVAALIHNAYGAQVTSLPGGIVLLS